MKLVRLATDNDGVFASAFQNDMIIAPQSQMALLNLTFQTNIGTFVVIPSGSTITFKSDTDDANTSQTVTIPERSFSVSEIEDYYKHIQHALNSAIKNDNARGAGQKFYNSVGSGFRIGTTDEGIKTIEYRYAPFINPITSFANVIANSMIWFNDYITPTVTGTGVNKQTEITKKAGEPAKGTRTYKVLPLNGRRLNDGSSILTDIPPAQRDFEIRFNRMGETYKYINNLSDEIDSTIQPVRVESATYPDVKEHDILFMEVSGNVLQLGVITDGGATATRNVFASINVAAGEELYPYLYIRGASTDVKVDMMNYTIDPWLPSIGGDERGNDDWQITGDIDTAGFNGYDDVLDQAPMNTAITQVDLDRFFIGADAKFNLLMPNVALRALGFTQFQGTGNAGFLNQNISRSEPVYNWKVIKAKSLPAAYTSDNFIVESMSLPLDSFDASKTSYPQGTVYVNPASDKRGRRKNILMTIPVNNNTSGLVEYESATPIFIDINNVEEINAKNLNFRILNKDFSPIIQGDESAIATILIKKQNE